MEPTGSTRWAIAEGYIPGRGLEGDRALESHEVFCLMNTGSSDANVEIILLFADRPPVGPYRAVVPSERTLHLRANDLDDPEPVPRDVDYAVLIEADVPVVVQHTRLDSRQEKFALLSASAHPVA